MHILEMLYAHAGSYMYDYHPQRKLEAAGCLEHLFTRPQCAQTHGVTVSWLKCACNLAECFSTLVLSASTHLDINRFVQLEDKLFRRAVFLKSGVLEQGNIYHMQGSGPKDWSWGTLLNNFTFVIFSLKNVSTFHEYNIKRV